MLGHPPESQILADLLPGVFRLRQDPYCLGRQLLLPIARRLTEAQMGLRWKQDHLYLLTAPMSHPYQLYPLYLADLELQGEDDPRLFRYRLPQLRGRQGTTWYTLESLWNIDELFQLAPQRLQAIGSRSLPTPLLSQLPFSQLPYTGPELPLAFPGPVRLKLQADLSIAGSQQQPPWSFRLVGQTVKDTWEEEVISGTHLLPLQSLKHWRKLSRIEGFGLPPVGTVTLGGLEQPTDTWLDDGLYISQARQPVPVIWSLQDSVLVRSWYTYITGHGFVLLPELRRRLLTPTGSFLPAGVSQCLRLPYSPWLLCLYGGQLHFYEAHPPYPPVERLSLAQQQRTAILALQVQASDWHVLPGETVEIGTTAYQDFQPVLSYSWWVAPPSGSLSPYRPQGGVLVPAAAETWVAAHYQAPEEWKTFSWELTLDEPGWWVVMVRARNAKGEYSQDARLIGALEQRPAWSYTPPSLPANAQHLFWDAQGHLWLANNSTAQGYQLLWDAGIVELQTRTILFTQPYDEVEVIP